MVLSAVEAQMTEALRNCRYFVFIKASRAIVGNTNAFHQDLSGHAPAF